MNTHTLPSEPVMLEAFLSRDASFDGIFITGVHTTGIFCRPTCPARKPKPENVSFFPNSHDALLAGYRPCRRCRPLEPEGTPPEWLRPLLDDLESDPTRRWRDADMRERGLSPERVRRWFQKHHGMTFQAYSRARRLGSALGRVREGDQLLHVFEMKSAGSEPMYLATRSNASSFVMSPTTETSIGAVCTRSMSSSIAA